MGSATLSHPVVRASPRALPCWLWHFWTLLQFIFMPGVRLEDEGVEKQLGSSWGASVLES